MKSTIMAAQIRSTKRPERRDFGKIREHIAERANIYLGFRGNLKNLASKFWTSNQSCVLLVFTIHNNLLKLSVWSNRSENYPRFLLGLFGILNSDHHSIHSFRILKSRKKNDPKIKDWIFERKFCQSWTFKNSRPTFSSFKSHFFPLRLTQILTKEFLKLTFKNRGKLHRTANQPLFFLEIKQFLLRSFKLPWMFEMMITC